MAISINPSISSLAGAQPGDNTASATTLEAQKEPNRQPSTVVSLSSQAQQLNRANLQSHATNNAVAPPNSTADNRDAPTKTATERQGVPFLAGASKGGRVNTYA